MKAIPRLLLLVLALLSTIPLQTSAQPQFLEIVDPPSCSLNPSQVSSVYTYRWQTVAGSADPSEVRFIILNVQDFGGSYLQTLAYIRNSPDAPEWSSWMPYAPPDVGTSWVSTPLDLGAYLLAVQGRDAMGVVEPTIDEGRNAIRLRNSIRTTGPLLIVTGDWIDPIETSVTTTPLTEITVESGTPLGFCWTASASAYCGVVAGYRYQWDIADPDDDAQWQEGFVPLPEGGACSAMVEFQVGTHTFTVEVIDNTGHKSRVPISASILPPNGTEQSTWGAVKALYRKP
jgi:hypothetical protein